MMQRVVAALGLALLANAHVATEQHLLRGKGDDLTYTLVQHRGLGCTRNPEKKDYVCQKVTKGACTITVAHAGGVEFTVHTKLEDNGDGSFTVSSCEAAGCDCSHTQQFVAAECQQGTYGTTSISYELVAGEVEGCLTNDFDVAGGRHHASYEMAMASATKLEADADDDSEAGAAALLTILNKNKETPDEKVKAKVAEQQVEVREKSPTSQYKDKAVKEHFAETFADAKIEEQKIHAIPSVSAAAFYGNWAKNEDLPEQGFEGPEVAEHEDFETTTKDWGHEYGPDMYEPKFAAGVAVFLAAALFA